MFPNFHFMSCPMYRILCLGFVMMMAAIAHAQTPTLEARLAPLAEQHKGQVAIAVKHLGTGESYFLHADEVMPTASLIKFPIMAECYFLALEGKLKLDDMLTLRKEEMVPGSGILTQHFSPGASFSLRDTVRLMIACSDNTATNMVLDKITIPATNTRMKALGFPETRINAKVFRGSTSSIDPDRTKQYGLGSTTARDMVGLLELLHTKKLVDENACKQMREHMLACDDDEKFPRFLPASVKIAFKTGSVSDARTAAGILDFPGGPVAVCVLTAKNEDKRWVIDNAGNKLCAQVAQEVYRHYLPK